MVSTAAPSLPLLLLLLLSHHFCCAAAATVPQVPLFQVSGRPIPVPKVDKNDTEKFNAAVDEVHAAVVDEMQALYDRHKATYGWADRPLSIE